MSIAEIEPERLMCDARDQGVKRGTQHKVAPQVRFSLHGFRIYTVRVGDRATILREACSIAVSGQAFPAADLNISGQPLDRARWGEETETVMYPGSDPNQDAGHP